jgi:hypothetical protein
MSDEELCSTPGSYLVPPTRFLDPMAASKIGPQESESHYFLLVLLLWSPGPKFRAMDQVYTLQYYSMSRFPIQYVYLLSLGIAQGPLSRFLCIHDRIPVHLP